MKIKHIIFLLTTFLLGFTNNLFASEQIQLPKLVQVNSDCMNEKINVSIVLPSSYEDKKEKKYPVIYLLHGFGGNNNSWFIIKPTSYFQEKANQYGIIFVSPNAKNSWYWDSPINPNLKFETFVSKELINYIDSNYPTIKNKNARAITGLSMGGQGALFLAINHKDVFGAAGSTSGGVDIRYFPNNWQISESLGAKNEYPDVWEKFTIYNQVDSLKPNELTLIIDCGTEDFFYKVNELLHKKLLKNKIPHDYITRQGAHNKEYWNNSIEYQILFFKNFFNKNLE